MIVALPGLFSYFFLLYFNHTNVVFFNIIINIIIVLAFIASSLTNVHLTRMLTVNVQLTVSHGILWQ